MIGWGLMLLTLLIGQASADEEVVTNPVWDSRPTAENLSDAFPARAIREEVEGASTISCSVTTTGGLTACVVVSESPEGYGFGVAALSLAPRFSMRPPTVDGRPVGGATVRIPIAWRFGGGSSVRSPELGPNDGFVHHSRSAGRVGEGGRRILVGATFAAAPSRSEVAAVAPSQARGSAVIRCEISRAARTTRCASILEQPTDTGLGRAAERLGDEFELRPSAEAPNLVGAFVDIRVQFGGDAPAYVTRPRWLRSATGEEMQAALEPMARPMPDRTVTALVDCEVASRGELRACRVIRASAPEVGAAVAALATRFAMSPWTDEGVSNVGARVRLPVRYEAE